MSFLMLVVVLAICGGVVYFVDGWKIDNWFKWAIKVVAIIVALYYILVAFGLLATLESIQVPKIR